MKRLLAAILFCSISLPPGPIYAAGILSGCGVLVERLKTLIAGTDGTTFGIAPEAIGTDPLFMASIAFTHDSASAAFAQNSRLILRQPLEVAGGAFPVSNEYDFFKTPPFFEPRDLVVGFATNSAWDIAVRLNAKTLILADWQETPLMGQEYLFRPLISIAKDRADFLSMLAGTPLTHEISLRPLDQIMDYLKRPAQGTQPSRTAQERLAFMRSVLERLRADPRFTDMHIQFLARYFHHLLARDHRNDAGTNEAESQIRRLLLSALANTNVAGPFRGPRIEVIAGDLYEHIYERYHPSRMIERGASPDELLLPYHNILSSDAAFARLQQLFDGHVYYVQASLFDPKLWMIAADLGHSRGATSAAASISNIVDCSYGGCHEGPGTVRAALSLIYKYLGPVDVFQTRGSKAPYVYEWIPIQKPEDINARLSALGYSPAELTAPARSRAQKVFRFLASNEPEIANVLTDRVEINYGKRLKVTMTKPKGASKDFGFEFFLLEDGQPKAVFFDIPEDGTRCSERVLLNLGELRPANDALNTFFNFYTAPAVVVTPPEALRQ